MRMAFTGALRKAAHLLATGACVWLNHEAFSCRDARAEPEWGPLDVHLGAQLGSSFQDYCQYNLSDVAYCSAVYFGGLSLGPRYRLGDAWALGVVGSWSPSRTLDDERTAWTAAAEARFYPLATGRSGLYVALDAGIVVIEDDLAAGELGPASHEVASAPLCGGSVGIDFEVMDRVSLGPSARTFVMFFSGEDSSFRPPDYPLLSGASLSFNVTVSPL